MAARTRKIRHDDETRAKIQSSQLINRLTDHVLGASILDPSQVSAALGLLRKTIPDLSASENKNETIVNYVARAEMPAKTMDEWLTRVGKPNGNGATIPDPTLQ